MRFFSMTSRTQPSDNYPGKPESHPKEHNSQTRDAKVQLANSGPPHNQHHHKDRGASVIPKICQSASSLTTMKAGPHDECLYLGYVTHVIEGGELAAYKLSTLIGRKLATCELSPQARHLQGLTYKLVTCELSPRARHLRGVSS